jgi:hypothetical protein
LHRVHREGLGLLELLALYFLSKTGSEDLLIGMAQVDKIEALARL